MVIKGILQFQQPAMEAIGVFKGVVRDPSGGLTRILHFSTGSSGSYWC